MKEPKLGNSDTIAYIATKLNEAGLSQSTIESRMSSLAKLSERVLEEIGKGTTADEILDLMDCFKVEPRIEEVSVSAEA